MKALWFWLGLLLAGSTAYAQQIICERLLGTGATSGTSPLGATGLYAPTADSILMAIVKVGTTQATTRSQLLWLGRAQCDTANFAETGRGASTTSFVSMSKTRRRDLLVLGLRNVTTLSPDTPQLQLQAVSRRGAVRWTRRYRNYGQGQDPTGVLEAPDRGIYFTTNGSFPGSITPQSVLYKVDSLGQLLWQHPYGRSTGDVFDFVAPAYTRRGTLLLAGAYAAPGYVQSVRVMEVGQHGDSLTTRVVMPVRPNIYDIHVNNLRALRDGGFLVSGYLDTLGVTTSYYPFFIRLDANLNVRWTHIYRQGQVAGIWSTKGYELADGTLLGVVNRGGNGLGPFASPLRFVHFSAIGAVLNMYEFIPTLLPPLQALRTDYIGPLAADSSWVLTGINGRAYLAHFRFPGLRAVVPLPGIPAAVPLGTRPAAHLDWQLYPNPASEKINVHFTLPPGTGSAQLRCTDALGRQVHTQAVPPGTAVATVVVAAWPPGLYVLTLEANGQVLARQRVSVQRE